MGLYAHSRRKKEGRRGVNLLCYNNVYRVLLCPLNYSKPEMEERRNGKYKKK